MPRSAMARSRALKNESILQYTVRWEQADLDGDPVSSTVEYSPDDGVSWRTLAVDLSTNEWVVPRNLLAGTSMGRIRVHASDGLNSSTDVSDATFSVADNPPELFIIHPSGENSVSGHQRVYFFSNISRCGGNGRVGVRRSLVVGSRWLVGHGVGDGSVGLGHEPGDAPDPGEGYRFRRSRGERGSAVVGAEVSSGAVDRARIYGGWTHYIPSRWHLWDDQRDRDADRLAVLDSGHEPRDGDRPGVDSIGTAGRCGAVLPPSGHAVIGCKASANASKHSRAGYSRFHAGRPSPDD